MISTEAMLLPKMIAASTQLPRLTPSPKKIFLVKPPHFWYIKDENDYSIIRE
ncbi:hypothetical protein [Lactobacillus sp.]|uniref:hypothetical protein n=1 Tax=Lactobacillus sp. TaxID=1591 RepID=UPI003EF60ED1